MLREVKLPRSQAPAFPPICVKCHVAEPTEAFRISDRALSSWTIVTPTAALTKMYTVEVPVCILCKSSMRSGRRIRRWLSGMVLIGVGLFGYFFLSDVNRIFQILGMVPMAIIWVGVDTFIKVRYTEPFNVSVGHDEITFEFSNLEYAAVFAVLNGGHVE